MSRVLILAGVLLTAGCSAWEPAGARAAADIDPDRAISKAVERILARQEHDGRWSGVATFATPQTPDRMAFTSSYILLLNRLGIDDDTRRRAVDYLVRSQRADGSWGDSSANFGALLALEQVGLGESDAARRVREFIRREGEEIDSVTILVKLFYAVAGRYEWSRVPLADALTTIESAKKDAKRRAAFVVDVGASIAILKTIGVRAPMTRPQLEALKHAEWLLVTRQLPTGSWFDYEGATIAAALALYELGYSATSPQIANALAFLKTLQQPSGLVTQFAIPLSETVLGLLALESAGYTVDDEPVRRGMQFLVDSRMPGGGWGYTPALRIYPDWDDVSLVLAVVGPSLPTVAASALPYALSLQNADGGWASFAIDLDPEQANVKRIPLNETTRMLWDPSLPEVTGHMLLAFGRLGHRLAEPKLAKAREYLKRVQFDNGMWFGYWGIGYLYGTSQTLLGLEAVREDPQAPYVRRAVQWLEARQQAPGCWGEDIRGVDDPQYAADGPCTAAQTSWAIIGLLAGGEPATSPAVQRGVRWLLAQQRPDGEWAPHPVMFVHVVEYYLMNDAIAWPVLALTKYRHALRTAPPTDHALTLLIPR